MNTPRKIFLNPPTSRSLQDIEYLYLTNKHIITGAINKAGMSIDEACECVVGGIVLEYKETYGINIFDNRVMAVEYFINRYKEDLKTGRI